MSIISHSISALVNGERVGVGLLLLRLLCVYGTLQPEGIIIRLNPNARKAFTSIIGSVVMQDLDRMIGIVRSNSVVTMYYVAWQSVPEESQPQDDHPWLRGSTFGFAMAKNGLPGDASICSVRVYFMCPLYVFLYAALRSGSIQRR